MFYRHVSRQIAALADGQLSSDEASRARTHLAGCDRCRAALDRYRFAAGMMRTLAVAEAPASIWDSIEGNLQTPESTLPPLKRARFGRSLLILRPAFALVTIVLAVAALVVWRISQPATYDVVRLDGRGGTVSVGEWIETSATTNAQIKIGEIGSVDIAPNTRVQLLAARPNEHRLNLDRGVIRAQITAPPRLFFVETRSSTVVDLGCAYTMEVDEAGIGLLRVTSGWASLEWDKTESLVPAGASAPTRPDLGPGTPSFDDASERLRQALLEFDYGGGGRTALVVVLVESRQRDTLTLWHLLSRADPADRALVFERMVALTPLPATVTREKALALDASTLRLWREELAWTW